jgi:general secretion pathway protein B
MSLILDALRRAETERERERLPVPGLYDQGHAMVSASGAGAEDGMGAERARSRLPWLLVLGAVLCAAALALWVLMPRPVATGVKTAEGSPSNAPAVLVPLPTLLPDPAPPPALRVDPGAPPLQPQLPGASAEPAPRPVPPPRPVPAAPLSGQAGPTPLNTTPAPAPQPVGAPTAITPPQAPSPADPLASPTTLSAPANIPLFRELPEPLRRELPPLTVNGAVYSPEAASRMLVLDGQVVREGQSVPGATQGSLVLERIGPKLATFSYKGQRFQLPL